MKSTGFSLSAKTIQFWLAYCLLYEALNLADHLGIEPSYVRLTAVCLHQIAHDPETVCLELSARRIVRFHLRVMERSRTWNSVLMTVSDMDLGLCNFDDLATKSI